MPTYKVIKDFDFAPHGNAVRTHKAGQTRKDLTRACVKKGKSLGALKLIRKKDS